MFYDRLEYFRRNFNNWFPGGSDSSAPGSSGWSPGDCPGARAGRLWCRHTGLCKFLLAIQQPSAPACNDTKTETLCLLDWKIITIQFSERPHSSPEGCIWGSRGDRPTPSQARGQCWPSGRSGESHDLITSADCILSISSLLTSLCMNTSLGKNLVFL